MVSKRLKQQGLAAARTIIRPLLSWQPLERPEPGFSIILGVPWLLRHLLPVNIRFVAATDLEQLHTLHIVFDRAYRLEADALIECIRSEYPRLPLRFHFYDRALGWVVERLHTANFYNSTNCAIGLRECRTRYAIIHDFDLYPLARDYFSAIAGYMDEHRLRFSGLEHTYVDGMTDHQRCVGTWALGIDAQWLRATHSPMSIYHRIATVDGLLTHLDPFSHLQLQTPARALVQPSRSGTFCHVRNLPSVHLQMSKGQRPNVVWRLHYLWYLESLNGDERSFRDATRAMEAARSSVLEVGGLSVDFSTTDWTCANVLRDELERMEVFLFGRVRPQVAAYLAAFLSFLRRIKGEPDVPASALQAGSCR